MIGALLKSGRKEDAMDMFTAISAHGLVPNVVTYQLVTENLINDGLLDEFENLFLTSCCWKRVDALQTHVC
jgi:leucine-rich PPR motif-containing protein